MSNVDLSKCKHGDIVLLRNNKVVMLMANNYNDADKYSFAHNSGSCSWHGVDINGKSCINDYDNDVVAVIRSEQHGEILTCEPTISLRDTFACNETLDDCDNWPTPVLEFLAGPKPNGSWSTEPEKWIHWNADWRAKIRYIRADAMLKARSEGPPELTAARQLREEAVSSSSTNTKSEARGARQGENHE